MKPRKRPVRLLVNLSPEMANLIFEISDLMGEPKSKVAAELLEQLRPALEAQLDYLRKAVSIIESGKKMKVESKEKLIADLEKQSAELETHVDETLKNVISSLEDLT
jgi:hypothetical protein